MEGADKRFKVTTGERPDVAAFAKLVTDNLCKLAVEFNNGRVIRWGL